MIRLARFCMTHRWRVIAFWVLAAVLTNIAGCSIGSDFKNKFSVPDTDSERAFEILGASFPDLSGADTQIVFHSLDGRPITDPETRASVDTMLAGLDSIPHVSDVQSPYEESRGETLSKDGTIGFASVTFNQEIGDLGPEPIREMVNSARKVASPELQVEFGGYAILYEQRQDEPGAFRDTLIGLAAAIVVLGITFGSLLAMGMPILTAALGLATGMAVVTLGSNFIDMADFSPQLAAMIGLGVGIDYALFILTRHREIYRQLGGHTAGEQESIRIKEISLARAMDSSGRAVVFAGITVVIAMMGMFALGFEFLYGVAIAASVGVLFVLISSLTVLPALIHLFGRRLGRRGRRASAREAQGIVRRGLWDRWIAVVERHAGITALVSALLILAMAAPVLGIRLGNSDSGNDPRDSTTRKAYDLLEEGFGPGFNGPFVLAMSLDKVNDRFAANQMATALKSTEGIASVDKPRLSPGRTAATVTAYPTTAPQSQETYDLARVIRREVIPSVESHTGATIYLGGSTAQDIDFTKLLAEKIPIFIGIVVLLSALLLMVVFRSLVIPLQAAVMNLMSIGAAIGLVVLIFQKGLIPGVEPGPIDSFIPVMVFAIVFGLSMDYEVFLVSRIHEEWTRSHDHSKAVRTGLVSTGRVITAAALVMFVVFAAFILGGERTIAMFGVSLASAVLIDAVIIRVMLLPAVLELVGPATWYFPHWLDRFLPSLAVESPESDEKRPPWPLWIKLVWATIVAMLIAGSTVWIVLADDDDETPDPVKVLAERGNVVANYTAAGKVVDPGELSVNFPNGGGGQRVVSVNVEMGDQVEKGDVLAVIESQQARSDLRAARSQLSGADVGRRSGSAQRAQSRSSVKAARRALDSSRNVNRAGDRGLDTAVRVTKDADRRATKNLQRTKKNKQKTCSGNLSTPDARAACTAAKSSLKLAKQAEFEAETAVKKAKRDRESGRAQQRDAVTAAKSGVKSARKADELTRAQSSGTGPPISAAEIQVRAARRNLNRTKLRAPAAGKIVAVAGRPSEYVGSTAAGPQGGGGTESAQTGGAPAASGFVILTDVDTLEVEAHFSQSDAAKLRPGQKATVTLHALDDNDVHGRVVSISPSGAANEKDVTFTTQISLRRAPNDLKVGQTAAVEVETGKARDVIYVPSAAVQTSFGRSVAAVMKRGVPRLRRVRVGVEGQRSTEIKSGIKVGDKVIVGKPRIDDD